MKKLILLVWLLSCNFPSDWVTYTIPAGKHESNNRYITQLTDNDLEFEVEFDSTAVYQTRKAENQYDINKLIGFSEGTDAHRNSARFGWNYLRNKILIYPYVYYSGIKPIIDIPAIDSLEIGEKAKGKITADRHRYILKFKDTELDFPRDAAAPKTRFILYPYFGGDETAPKTINIKIRIL